MPVQCNQGWLADLRLCGPFSRRWRSFFIDTGTGGIAFPLQQHSFMPDTMRYYWFWIEMLILGTGQLGLRACPAHFSFFTWLRWSVSMGKVNPQLSFYYNTLVPSGCGLRAYTRPQMQLGCSAPCTFGMGHSLHPQLFIPFFLPSPTTLKAAVQHVNMNWMFNDAPSYKGWEVSGKRWNLQDTSSCPGSCHYWSWGHGGKTSSYRAGGVR